VSDFHFVGPSYLTVILLRHASDVTSEHSTIAFNIYDRAQEDHGFLGNVQLKPILVHDHTVDHWYRPVALPLFHVLNDAVANATDHVDPSCLGSAHRKMSPSLVKCAYKSLSSSSRWVSHRMIRPCYVSSDHSFLFSPYFFPPVEARPDPARL